MRTVLFLTIAALAFAPLAGAEENSSRPDDAAWTEDCPPDMLCAAGAPECTTTEDGAEMCPDGMPHEFGPDGCIDCTGPTTPDRGEADLDGRGPADCENCRGDTAGEPAGPPTGGANPEVMSTEKSAVPAPAVAGVLLAAAVGAIALIARRR